MLSVSIVFLSYNNYYVKETFHKMELIKSEKVKEKLIRHGYLYNTLSLSQVYF